MELFELAFEKTIIYETLFFNIVSATTYPNVYEFKEKKPELFKQWELIAKSKYKINEYDDNKAYMAMLNDTYLSKAIYFPEFTKIIGITYGTVEASDGKIMRHIKKIDDNSEFEIIKKFQQILHQISSDGVKSTPQYFPTLCGHNIINNDIPLFIKRLFHYRNEFDNNTNLLPFILKKYLQAKPWDSNILDTINLWKFNSISNTPLSVVSDFLGLKRKIDIMTMEEISKYYWNNINDDKDRTMKHITMQSANQLNLVIQIINELRSL